MGLVPFTKRPQRAPPARSPGKDTARSRQSAAQERALPQPRWCHDLGLLASRNVRYKCLLFISYSAWWYLVTAAQMD